MFELTADAPDASPIYAEVLTFNAENLALDAPVYGTIAADKIKPQIVASAAVESITRAREYLDGDWLPVPLKPDTDQVNCDRWSELQLTDETVADYFEDDSNIGIELGQRSGGLTCLHLCTEDAAIAGEYLAPPTGSRFSLESERHSSHLLYTTKLAEAENAPRAISYVDPTDSKPLVEIVIGGAAEPAYMVFPPSVVDQECVQWDERQHEYFAPEEPPEGSLLEGAKFIALVSILARHWHRVAKAPNGVSETKVARALGGFLHHAGIARPDALRILSCLVAATASGAPRESRNFQDYVGYHDNYHIPSLDSEANVKKLAYTPALGPFILLGGVFGNPVIHAISNWFDYDPNKSHGDNSTTETTAPKQAAAIMSLNDWAGRDLSEPDYLLGHWLTTTSRTLLTADTGLGKTLAALALGMRAAAGKDFLHWVGRRPSRVLFIDGEMSRRVMKRRLADEACRLSGPPPEHFYTLSHEDVEGFAPLNSPPGQKFVDDLIDRLGGVDLVIFDNIMSLIAGDQKDEEGWRETLPWTRSLTQRSIGQIWVHHTGHDASRQYGTKTREWQMENSIMLERVERPDTDVSFTWGFRKARERAPHNRADFGDVEIALLDNRWIGSAASAKTKLESIERRYFEALRDATTGNDANRMHGHAAASLDDWQRECAKKGLIDTKAKPDSARALFSKYKLRLIAKNWVAANETMGWIISEG